MMGKLKAAITGVEGWVPEDKITNADLEKMVDTSDEWIITRTGIRERRIARDRALTTSEMSARAAQRLLAKTNTSPDEIDLVICATITPDMVVPSASTVVCDKLGIKNAWAWDMNAACSGYIYAITAAQQFIETGRSKKVLLLASDKMTSIVDYQDRNTCPLFGDAGTATLLEPTTEEFGIIDTVHKTDGIGRQFLYMKAGGCETPASHESVNNREHFVYQEGKSVFKYAVKGMADIAVEVMERNNLSHNDISWLVPHQANLRIIEAVGNRMNLPKEKVMVNISKYGNTTAATIPLCLWEWEKQLKKGDNIILAAFGGGFTWGAVYLKWAY